MEIHAGRSVVLVGDAGTRRKERAMAAARQALAADGWSVVDAPGLADLSRLTPWVERPARERPLIVAAGGDGTVGAVAGYLVNTDCPLAILPLGTSNDIARTLQIPLRIPAAVRLLREGRVATIDAGEYTGHDGSRRAFLHAAAMGASVQFARLATRSSVRSRLGPFTYVAVGLLTLRRLQPFDCRLEFEGDTLSLRLIHLSVVNAPIFGGLLGLQLPGSDVDDRKLDLLAVEDRPLPRLLLSVAMLLAGARRAPGVRMSHVRHLRVRAAAGLEVSLDGEVCGEAPAEFAVNGEGLRVIVPPSFLDVDD